MNKRIKLVTAVVALLMVAAIVVTFEACKKEEAITETTQKTPIAVKNVKTGEITYNVSLNAIQTKLNDYAASKGGNEIIVESWSVTDDGPNNSPVLRLSFIDVDDEVSSNIGLCNAFVESSCIDDVVEYYITESVLSGTYQYLTSNGEASYLVTVENDDVVSIELYGAKASWAGGVSVTCKTHRCLNDDGCKPDMIKIECSYCEGTCEQTITATSSLTHSLSAFR